MQDHGRNFYQPRFLFLSARNVYKPKNNLVLHGYNLCNHNLHMGIFFSITLFIACVIGKIHHYMLEKSQVVHQEKVYIVRSLLTVHLRG